jgi:hypothetical protein
MANLLFLEHFTKCFDIMLAMFASIHAKITNGGLALDAIHTDILLSMMAAFHHILSRFTKTRR